MVSRLRRRLTAVCAVGTGLVLTGMAAVFLRYSLSQLQQQSQEAFESSLNTVYFYLRGQDVIDHTWLARTETAGGLLIRVDAAGEELSFARQNPLRARLTDLAVEMARTDYQFDIGRPPSGTVQPDVVTFALEQEGASYRAAVARVPGPGVWYGVVVLGDRWPEQAQARSLRLTFAACVAIALGLLSAVAWLFTGWAVRPIVENQRRQSEFVSAAGHELRSPLAVMRVTAGNIEGAPAPEAVRFARVIQRECDRLARLTGDLLQLAGSDSGRLEMAVGLEEPETLLLGVGESFEPLAAQKGIRVALELPDDPLPRVRCDRQRLEQALTALLDNALRFTPPGGVIRCGVDLSRKWVRFFVADSGPGIPDEEKERVMERFYQGDAARTGKEHFGLGLAIVREIARLHRGTLAVKDAREGGAEFVLCVPVSDPAHKNSSR